MSMLRTLSANSANETGSLFKPLMYNHPITHHYATYLPPSRKENTLGIFGRSSQSMSTGYSRPSSHHTTPSWRQSMRALNSKMISNAITNARVVSIVPKQERSKILSHAMQVTNKQ